MATPDLIRIKNVGDKPLVLNGNERYEIAPGEDRIVAFHIAASWFGDPRAKDDTKERVRTDVYRQVRMLWGYSEGIPYHSDPKDLDSPLLTWDDMRPYIECSDMDGNSILFVIDDPKGEHIMGGSITDAENAEDPRIAQLQDQVAQLIKLVESQASAAPVDTAAPTDDVVDSTTLPEAPVGSDVVTDDAPRAPRSGGRKKAAAAAAR